MFQSISQKVISKNIISRGQRYFGRYGYPKPSGEPLKQYAPGSNERKLLRAAINQVVKEQVEVPCIIGGKSVYTGNIVKQVMPSRHGHTIALVHQAGPKEIQDAIEIADQTRHEWSRMPHHHRALIFRKAGDLIANKYRAHMNAVTMMGTGKNVWQAEIDSAVEQADFLRLNGYFAEQIYEEQPPLNADGTWNRMKYRELEGFIATISPFNFCAIGANLNAAPALMGNVCLWKPSQTAVLENYVTYQIFKEAGLPDGVINFLPSHHESFSQVFKSPKMAGIHFTGSTPVFNTIWKTISNNLSVYTNYPRIVGETGGKNFHMIHPSADMQHAVYNTVRAAFEYQGQKCSACSRLYVPKSLWNNGFKDLLLDTTSKLKMGDPEDFSIFLSAVIDEKATSRHKEYLDQVKASQNSKILIGGNIDISVGYFVEPTIIETSDPFSPTMVDELFGPILTVYVYDDTKPDWSWIELLKLADRTTKYGLTASVFATDRVAIVEAEDTLHHTAGNLYFNDKCTGAVVGEQPFGGSRASGTNDKAGSHLNLLRWVSPQTIKENTIPLTSINYSHMEGNGYE